MHDQQTDLQRIWTAKGKITQRIIGGANIEQIIC